MGSYTPNFKFYKPESNEFVDVDHNWNRNLQITDSYAKPLMEWSYATGELQTNLSTPVGYTAPPYFNGAKVYDSSRNDLIVYWNTKTEPLNSNQHWTDGESLLASPFVSFGDDDNIQYRLTYEVLSPGVTAPGKVEFAGKIQQPSLIALNTTVSIMSGLGAENLAPLTPKTFNVAGEDSATEYCYYQIGINTDGTVTAKRFGSDPDVITNTIINLSGIYYYLRKNS